MSYYWIHTGQIRTTKTKAQPRSERETYEETWSKVVGHAYVEPSVSYKYENNGQETSTFAEVPYPLTEEEADKILEEIENGDLSHLRSEFTKRPYDLEGFVDAKERKGNLVPGTLNQTVDELREPP